MKSQKQWVGVYCIYGVDQRFENHECEVRRCDVCKSEMGGARYHGEDTIEKLTELEMELGWM